MTLIDKIKKSVEGATALDFLYHAAGEMNELIARAERLPVAFAFLIDSGTIEDVNGRYHERVTLAVMFTDKTQFDFNALENEEIIERMKVKAYKWLESLRNSNDLQIVSVNSTQRLYDTTTDVLTGYAVNITLQDMYGVGECELPEVVIDVDKNGSYNVVGIDKVRVNVVPKLEELEITQNGEYLPPTDIAGFSKVNVDVQPILEELTVTQNGTYTPQDGVDGFSKVTAQFDTSSLPKVKVSQFYVTDACINDDGIWEGESLIDTSECTNLYKAFSDNKKITSLNASSWDTSKLLTLRYTFQNSSNLKYINLTGWNLSSIVSGDYHMQSTFNSVGIEDIIGLSDIKFSEEQIIDMRNCFGGTKLTKVDLSKWKCGARNASFLFINCRNLTELNMRGFNFSQCTSINRIIETTGLIIADFSYTDGGNINDTQYAFSNNYNLTSLIGGESIENVIANDIYIFKGLKIASNIFPIPPTKLDRASLRALINGIADLTGQTAQTLTLGATLIAKLTEEDIAIATSKNWTIV